jgi:signal transduction histidine kinase
MLSKEEFGLILYVIGVLFVLIVFGVSVFIIFQKKKTSLIQEQMRLKFEYENEIAQAKNEIQESTLKNVAMELHDNIGQLLSVANMQLNLVTNQNELSSELSGHLAETKSIIQNAVGEVRSLSKSLNTEVIQNLGLARSIEIELDRIGRLKKSQVTFEVLGHEQIIKATDEIIIFRIFQEFLSNSIKHAMSEEISVSLNFKEDALELHFKDNGQGFDTTIKSESSGLYNMKSRAKLINAQILLESKLGQGTTLELIYPYNQQA